MDRDDRSRPTTSRRRFLALVARVAIATPLAARSQPLPMPRIGYLSARSPGESAEVVAAFRRGLDEAGFSEGRNVAITYRWAEGHYERLPALAAELVRSSVTLVFAAGGPVATRAAKNATPDIPIVFSGTSDPVGLGLVASLDRPGGNVTGMSFFTVELVAKCLEILKELRPRATLAYFVNPASPSSRVEAAEAEAAATRLGIPIHVLKASSDRELERAYAALAQLRVGALAVPPDAYFDSHRDALVALSARYSVPAIYPWRDYVTAGGLMSYGSSITDSYRAAGVYTGRILKGESPANLPIQLPTHFELVINVATAKSLGITVPPSLLLRADEVLR